MRAASLGFASLFALVAASGGAVAQDETPVGASAGEERDEIIVSARRREESLQDVPVAVSAFSGDELADIGAKDLRDIGNYVPNITLKTSRATNTTLTAFVRGVGQQDPVSGFEAGVGIYIDDVYLNRPQAALLDIYNVDRIEVLRGPQGTLYGRNTIGGAVKYVTRSLGDEAEANLRLTGGTYAQFSAIGSFNLPIALDSAIGDLKLGGSVAYLRHNGFGENLTNGLENYNQEVLAGRLTVQWDPSEDISFKVSGDWTDDNSDPRQGHRLLDYPGSVMFGFAAFPVLDDVYDTRAGLNTPEQSVVAKGISWTTEWQTSEHFTVKNILSYREDRTLTPIDFDSLPLVDLDVPGIYDNDQFSEEFQLLYESDRIHGLMGFYYLNANGLTEFDVVLGTTATVLGFPNVLAFTSSDVNTKSWSFFTDWTFDLSDAFAVSLGGRYTNDRRSMSLLRQRYFTAGFSPTFGGPDRPPSLIDADFEGAAEFTDFSPRASITWEASPDHTLYVSYAQGFKGGSFDPRCAAPLVDLDGDGVVGAADQEDQVAFCRFKPENIATYEAGWKNVMFNGRFRSNLAVFYSKYKDVQVPGSVGIDTNMDGIADTFAGVTTNAAKATIYGVEYEGDAALAESMFGSGDSLSWQFSLGYIHPEYDEYVGRGSPPPDLSDTAVFQNTPKWNAYNRLTYSAPMGLFGDGSTSLYGAVAYKSLTHQFGFAGPLDQPQYAVVDAGIFWKSESGHLKLGVYGTNLTDKRYKVAGYDFVTALPAFGNSPLGVTGVLTAFYGDPRQIFGTIEVAF
jgi:iron complex outermembrane receptor protein